MLHLIGRLPLKACYRVGGAVAFLAEKVFRYRSDVVMTNLSRCFPEKKYKELSLLKHEFYRHFGDLVAETLWFGATRDPERLRKAHIVELSGLEEVNRVFEKAPSVMVMYSHCGNWELYGGIASYNYSDQPSPLTEDNTVVVYKKMKSRMWDEIIRDNRLAPVLDKEGFEGYVESNELVRFVLEHRDRKMCYNVNTDQSPYKFAKACPEVEFMHQTTRTMTAAAALARKVGMAVFYLNMKPVERGRYVMQYTLLCEDASGVSPEEMMARYYELLEKDINETPSNYLWTHKRWK